MGEDSFTKDPPNATVSVLSKDGASVADAVVALRSPELEGDTLTFDRNRRESMKGASMKAMIDYSDDGFLFDVVQQGPIAGLTIRY